MIVLPIFLLYLYRILTRFFVLQFSHLLESGADDESQKKQLNWERKRSGRHEQYRAKGDRDGGRARGRGEDYRQAAGGEAGAEEPRIRGKTELELDSNCIMVLFHISFQL